MSMHHGPGDRAAFASSRLHHNVSSHGYGEYEHAPPATATNLRPNYPPQHNGSNPSITRTPSPNMSARKAETGIPDHYIARTPSPTPSEAAYLKANGFIDWKAITNWRFWARRDWLWYYVIFAIILIITILISVYDRQIIRWLQPTATKIRDLPAGWIIPIVIFFIISFPPLFGHEVLAILCGVVWGLGAGFGITAAGTFLGEIGNFYAFRYYCHARGEKLERTNLRYACLAQAVRDGGFLVALVARYSAIPGHFTTAVFSTCGMGILVFAAAAALSLPKQFVTVYIGVIIEEAGSGTESTKDRIVSYVVLAITIAITCLAMHYISKKMNAVKSDVVYQRRKARQTKLERATTDLEYSAVDAAFNPRESDSDLPLNPGESDAYQRWDSQGRAIGYAGDPRLYAPAPRRESVLAGSISTVVQRENSTDNATWEMGPDAYRMPTFSSRAPATNEPTNQERGTVASFPVQATTASLASARSNNPLEHIESQENIPALPPPPSSPHMRVNFYQNSPPSQQTQQLPPIQQALGNTASPTLSALPYLAQQHPQTMPFAQLPVTSPVHVQAQLPPQSYTSSIPSTPIAQNTGLYRRESVGLPDRLPSPRMSPASQTVSLPPYRP